MVVRFMKIAVSGGRLSLEGSSDWHGGDHKLGLGPFDFEFSSETSK